MDPRELSIEQQISLLTDGPTPEVPSGQQPNSPDGNNGRLSFVSEWTAEALSGLSKASENAPLYTMEGFDEIEVASKEPLENAVDWQTPVHGSPSRLDFNDLFEPPCPLVTQREMDIFHSLDQDPSSKNLTQAENRHLSQEVELPGVNEDGNDDTAESTSFERQDVPGHEIQEHLSDDANGHRTGIGKSSVRYSGVNSGQSAVKVVRVNRSRVEKSTIAQTSGINPMLLTRKRTGSTEGNRAIMMANKGSKNHRSSREPLFGEETARLEAYISQRRRKCEQMGLPCPGDFVNNAEISDRLRTLGLDDYAKILKDFIFTIGGCESLAALKEILRAYRNQDVKPPQAAQEISNATRLKAIKTLGGNAAYMNLLRKCHIHRLFKDNLDPLRNSNDNFVVSTAGSIALRVKRVLGNPRNSAEAEITKSIIREIYPAVHLDSPDYRSKYREISDLRRHGRRLDIIVSRFGIGVLALLPLAQDDSITGIAFKIADSMYVPRVTCSLAGLTFNQDNTSSGGQIQEHCCDMGRLQR